MDNNLTPIKDTTNQEELSMPNLKAIVEEPQPTTTNDELVEIPNWNIEPPIEINRGQNDIR